MKIAILFTVLLTLSAATIANVAIASNVFMPVPTGQMPEVMSDEDSNYIPRFGDPVGGGGSGGG